MKSSLVTSKRAFTMSGIALILGLVGSIAWFNYALGAQTNHINDFLRVPPRSGLTMEISSAGHYTVWAGAACSGYCSVPAKQEFLDNMELSFDGPGGLVTPIPFDGTVKYRVSGTRFGTAVWTADFPEPGTYDVVRRNLGVGSSVLQLGKGHGLSPSIRAGIYTISALSVAGFLAFGAVGFWLREREFKAMMLQVRSGYQTRGEEPPGPQKADNAKRDQAQDS